MEKAIRMMVRKEVNKLFEIMEFQSSSSEQLASNMALYKLPRKGMDDSINYFNLVQTEKNKNKPQEEKEEDLENSFSEPSQNGPRATTLTNIYEEKEIGESYGAYGSTEAAKQNLDWERLPTPKKGMFSQDAQDAFDLHNNNIERSLNEVPPGDARTGDTKYPKNATTNKKR